MQMHVAKIWENTVKLNLQGREIVVLLALAYLADAKGRVHANSGKISEMTNYSVRNVRHITSALVKRNVITKDPDFWDDGGFKGNVFQLTKLAAGHARPQK